MMRSIIFVFIMLFCGVTSAQDYDEQIRVLSGRLVARIPQNQIATVLDFTDLNENSTQLGRLLAQDMFDQMLVLAPHTTWIDPSRRDFVLKENKLAADRLTDPSTQKRLGKLLNVSLIVVGTTVNLGDSVRLQVRVIDVETTRVWSSGSVTLQLQSEMLRLDRHSVSGSPSTSGAPPSGYVGSRRFESAGSIEVSLQSVTILSNRKIEFSLGLRNTRPNQVNVMVAMKAMHSDGIADFWKMFPMTTSRVITSQGDEYACRKASGIGYARERSDWAGLIGADTRKISLTCDGPNVRQDLSLDLVLDLWVAEGKGGHARSSEYSVRFSGISADK